MQMMGLGMQERRLADANARDDGWASLGGVGSHIGKIDTAFDARNYGFKKLSELVRSLKYLGPSSFRVELDSKNTM